MHLQPLCDPSFDAFKNMKFRVLFDMFILFVSSSVTLSVTCLHE